MIIGIGTDICDIRRIERAIERHKDRFTARIFTQNERDYCEPKSGKAAYYAKRFAAKEAAAKALARSNTGSLSWHDVEVVNDPSGRPNLRFTGGAAQRANENTPQGHAHHAHLSLSDDYPYAQAFVVIEAVKS